MADMEQQVLEAARQIEASGQFLWGATTIQQTIFPDIGGFRSVELGISAAIQSLIRKDYLRRPIRGLYQLNE